MPVEIRNPVLIPVKHLHPNSWNPNVQSDVTFNELVLTIEEEGFDHPLTVCPISPDMYDPTWPEGEHFVIISGEHRWKAAHYHDMTDLPCVIQLWDEVTQKTKTMRKNLLTGATDPRKFTQLVESLTGIIPREEMSRAMGFDDEKEFQKLLIKDQDPREKSFLEGLLTEAQTGKYAVDGLSDIIGNILAHCGETLDQGYIVFTYKGKTHWMVLCDDPLMKDLHKVKKHLSDTGDTATDFMREAVKKQLT